MAYRVPFHNGHASIQFPDQKQRRGEDSVRMANELRTEVEQVKQDADVKRALKETSTVKTGETPKAETKDKLWLGTHVIVVLALVVLYYVLQFKVFGFAARLIPFVQRLDKTAIAIVLLLAAAKMIDVYLIGSIDSPVARYNLRRVAKLTLALFLIATVIFLQNWYTTLISIGVLSLILGLAVQTPVTSFLGWIYILARSPYRVGDRIKIGAATGDVIDVSYLDTTLWEFGGGDLLSTDHPTGRVIKFPNSKILSSDRKSVV